MRRTRSAFLGTAVAAVLGLVVSCTAGTSQSRTPPPGGAVEVSQVVGPSGMKVRFPGGWVDVPAGAVARQQTLHVRSAPPLPSAPASRLMHSMARGITVDLSGLQPRRPLSIALPVSSALPSGVRPQALFVATVPSQGAAPLLLAASYDSTDHVLITQAGHLSSFYSVWLDGQSVVRWLTGTMAQLLQIRAPRPPCVDQPVQLADGSTVKYAPGTWSDRTDPLLWGCLAGSGSDPGHVVVALTDNRPMGYSVQLAPGASLSRDPPTLDSSTARLLFDIASAGKARDLELLTAASTVRITVPDTGLASGGPPVVVAAVRANQAVVAASAAQTAFLILDALLEHGTGRASAALSAALEESGNIDCVMGAVTAPAPLGLDQVVGGAQLGLRCLGPILKGSGAVAVAMLAIATSFFATFTGAVNLVLSQLTGTDTLTVALQRHPAAPIPTDPNYWANQSYTVACPGIAPQRFSVTVHNGHGHGAPQSGFSQGFDVVVGGTGGFAAGDLTGDGQPEVALIIGCGPSQAGPSYYTNEVQVFTAGVNGPKLLARLTPPFPASGLGNFPPIFGSRYNPVFEIHNGVLVTSVLAWAPGDCHACASINRTVSWRWNGQSFVPSIISPTCPNSAQLLSAWNAAPAAVRDSWAGVQITGFNYITCWNGWVVAQPISPSPGNGLIVFSLTGKLHLITTAELQQTFTPEVCSSPDAPPDWKKPPLISCN